MGWEQDSVYGLGDTFLRSYSVLTGHGFSRCLAETGILPGPGWAACTATAHHFWWFFLSFGSFFSPVLWSALSSLLWRLLRRAPENYLYVVLSPGALFRTATATLNHPDARLHIFKEWSPLTPPGMTSLPSGFRPGHALKAISHDHTGLARIFSRVSGAFIAWSSVS